MVRIGPYTKVLPFLYIYVTVLLYFWHNNSFLWYCTLKISPSCLLKLSRVELVRYLNGRWLRKTKLLLEEVLRRPAVGACGCLPTTLCSNPCIDWFASSLLSTNKQVCDGHSGTLIASHHPGVCCTLVVDEEFASFKNIFFCMSQIFIINV